MWDVRLCSESRRMLAIRACSRAIFLRALPQLAEPRAFRLRPRDSLWSRFRLLRSAFGPSNTLPSLSVASAFTPKIHADRRLGFANGSGVPDLDGEAGEPAIRHARHGDGLDVAGEAHRLAHTYPADDGQLHAPSIDLDGIPVLLVRAVVGAEAVTRNALLLEGRVFGPTIEKVLEGHAKVLDRLLRCVLRHLPDPRKGVTLDGIQITPQGCLRRLRGGCHGSERRLSIRGGSTSISTSRRRS
jgi:hypothetical protein